MRPSCCHPGLSFCCHPRLSWFPIKDTLHFGFLCNFNVSGADKAHFDHTGFILLFSILTLCQPPLTEREASQHQVSVRTNNGLRVFAFSHSAAAWHWNTLLLMHLSSHCWSVTQVTTCTTLILIEL